MDADELADFLALYAQACADAGVEPLLIDELAELARLMLAGAVAGAATTH